ncbi:MAG: cysteine peptidase family C39 domain-containing protein [Actinobacteria bacterium]|nr:cysteine peptidase family C39 domain-containing protein [Actinomycetota bacterium]
MSTQTPVTPSKPAGHSGRVKVPTIAQMEEADCGAASLGMILAHYGCWVPLEELRVACGVSRDGANALAVVNAARHYGFEAQGGRVTAEEMRDRSMPAIGFWRQSHFVVIEGIVGDTVFINNPTGGEEKISFAEFKKNYSEIGLFFQPTDKVEKRARENIGLRGTLGGMVASSRNAILLIVLSGLLLSIPGVAAPVLTSMFVDSVLGATGTVPVLGVIIAGFVLVTLLIFSLTLLQQLWMLRLQIRLSGRQTERFLTHMISLPTSYFDARQPGGLVQKVLMNSQLAQLLSGQLGTVVINAVSMVVYAVVMFFYSPTLTFVGIGMAAINLVVLWYIARVQTVENQRLQQAQVLQTGQAFVGLSLISNIKAMGSENEFFNHWAGAQAIATNAEQRVGRLTQGVAVIPAVLIVLNTVVILTIGSELIDNDALTIGGLVAFQGLLLSFVSPLGQFVTAADQFQSARGQIEQLSDVTSYPADPLARSVDEITSASLDPQPMPVARLAGRIELRGVSFGYNPSRPPFLKDFDLVVEPGQRVALVGPSVSGKSTVGNLITGLFAPWSGEILLDGKPRDSWPRELVTASLAKVDQQIMLFQGTVRQNVSLFDSTISADDIRRAAADAQILDEIDRRTGGFGSPVNEGGTNFSGGQGQRMEIARALAGNPSILILDEATSALDAVAEARFGDALRARGITVIMIAHRLSTIRDADLIVVLDEGAVVGRGTHESLLENCPTYVTLVGDAS